MEVTEALLYFCIAFVLFKFIDYLISLPTISNIKSQYVFITGCDTGFGNAVAKKLDLMGCNVIAGCLTERGETDLRKKCSDKIKTITLDVTKHYNVLQAFEQVRNILPQGKGKPFSSFYFEKI